MQNQQGHQQANLSEQELLNDLIMQEKQITGAYATYIAEASCPNLRNILTQNMNEAFQGQYQVFDIMRKKGLYPTKDAQQQDVQQAKQKFQQMMQQLQ